MSDSGIVDAQQRVPLLLTIIATCLAWGAWVFAIAFTNPDATGAMGYLAFYTTLLAAVSGSATLIGLFARRHADERAHAVAIAIRQGVLAGIAMTTAVFLQSRELLTWVNALALIAMLTLLELFVISVRRTREQENARTGEP